MFSRKSDKVNSDYIVKRVKQFGIPTIVNILTALSLLQAIEKGKEAMEKTATTDFSKKFYLHDLREVSMLTKVARQFSLYFGE